MHFSFLGQAAVTEGILQNVFEVNHLCEIDIDKMSNTICLL